jgi:uncharacterized protein YgiM (DUF1202 family)
MSGGADFEPAPRIVEDKRNVVKDEPVVARADTSAVPLTGVAPVAEAVPVAAIAKVDEAKIQALTESTSPEPAVAPVILASLETVTDAAPAIVTRTEPAAVIDAAVVEDIAPEPQPDIRYVSGNSVNMRTGPGTSYSVLARLSRGEEVEILRDPGNGWVKLRTVESSRIGWMAEWLVEAAN